MDKVQFINEILHIVGIVYMSIIGMYLLFTKRSIFKNAANQSSLMRKTTGVASLAWGASFAIGYAEHFLSANYNFDFYSLSIILDLFIAPVLIVLLLSMIQVSTTTKSIIAYNLLPILLLITFIFTQETWIVTVVAVYWSIDAVFFLRRFHTMQKIYKEKLKENFSDLENRELKWINTLAWLFVCYAALYLVGHLCNIEIACIASYIICMIGWTFILWHVEHQKVLFNFWDRHEAHNPLAQISDEDTFEEKVDLHPMEYRWIHELLKKECEETKLYLQPDLSIAELAKQLGTNRSYLNQFFGSQDTSFYNYINKLRIDHAVSMIKDRQSGVSMDEISKMSGFLNPDTFRKAFAEQMGCTPALYIAKLVGRKDIR